MTDKIRTKHLTRLSAIYIRQSSPGQVRNNKESYRVQKRLAARAKQLGWADNQTRTFEADQGHSASAPKMRGDFDALIQMIQDQQVGIVFSVDVGRLARNSIDMSMLIHWCAVHGTLVSDQQNVYDPALPEDHVVLGIQGVLAVSELHAIRKRLRSGLEEKASRGELYHAVPRGYAVIDGKHLRKHPDRRVQQTIQRVLDRFVACPSVSALLRWAWEQNIKLPRTLDNGGTRVEWVQANYHALMNILRNPTYAGIYVYPRYQRETRTLASGRVHKHRRLSGPDEWTIILKDHHPAYISFSQYQINQEKIAMNAQRNTSSRSSVNRGASLLAGLIECRRCGHMMQVQYSKRGYVSYYCSNGRPQRDSEGSRCFRFAACELEEQLSEQILYAVGPAGVMAAERAMQQLASERAERRKALLEQLEQLQYEADLTRRRLEAVDPENHLVYSTLCDEWEINLRAVSDQELLLSQFDEDDPPRPTSEERTLLQQLGERLEQVWYDTSVDGRLKQQVVRTLIDHVYADLIEDQDEVVLWVKWTSGHHTEIRAPRRRTPRRRRPPEKELHWILDTLRKIADDASISRSLNRAGIKTQAGENWTAERVATARSRLGVRKFDKRLKAKSGWLTQAETATKLKVSPMSVNRLIQAGVINSESISGLPQVILSSDLSNEAVQAAAKQVRNHKNAPLPTNPNQKNLSF
jgi:DNA invertase Pin-like site-specific DNA recombinase